MKRTNLWLRMAGAALVLAMTAQSLKAQNAFIDLQPAGRYETMTFGESATEIAAYDPQSQRLFSTNAFTGQVDVLDISDPEAPALLFSIDLSAYGSGANSVAFRSGFLACAVEADVRTDNGSVVFFDADGNYVNSLEVGALPDMITITPNGDFALTANEGEPSDDYLTDPLGTISIIDLRAGIPALTADDVTTLDFSAFNDAVLDPSIKINGPGASVAMDLEPEYIAVSSNSKFAYVTIQEANAVAIVQIESPAIVGLVGLGFKDHMLPGNGLDASDKADNIDIVNWPVKGLFMPDAIGFLRAGSGAYLITANEGDSRDYDAFSEEDRIKDVILDTVAFPNYAGLQNDDSIGRLKIINTMGDIDGDGDYDELYTYGARSFSVWDLAGNLVYDSGDELEQLTAAWYPDNFNASNDNQDLKNRSDDKGPEPEALAIGRIFKNPYLFLGLERMGEIMVYDMSDPASPSFVTHTNSRDFSVDPEDDASGDYGPEGLLFIPATQSPNGRNLLVTSNEVSGSIAIYYTDYACGASKVSVCYDGVSYCLPITVAEALVTLGGTPGPCDGMRSMLGEEDLALGINAYPNPASDHVNIVLNDLPAGNWNLRLFDITGRMVFTGNVENDGSNWVTYPVDVQQMPAGTYTCQVTSNNGVAFSTRIAVVQ